MSLSAVAAYWPRSARVEYWAGVASVPSFGTAGQNDGVGDLYVLAAESGELAAYGDGRVIDRAEFLADALDALEGSTLAALGGDRYRAAEIEPVLKAAALPASCAIVWRGQGAGQFAHGSRDVRAFQSAVEGGRLLVVDGLLAAHAYAGCCLRRDPSGNPALDKSRASSRIDLLSALVIAAASLRWRASWMTWRWGPPAIRSRASRRRRSWKGRTTGSRCLPSGPFEGETGDASVDGGGLPLSGRIRRGLAAG